MNRRPHVRYEVYMRHGAYLNLRQALALRRALDGGRGSGLDRWDIIARAEWALAVREAEAAGYDWRAWLTRRQFGERT